MVERLSWYQIFVNDKNITLNISSLEDRHNLNCVPTIYFCVQITVIVFFQYQRKLLSGFLFGMLCWTLFATSWRVLAFQTGGEMKQSKIELQSNFLQFFLVEFFNSLVFDKDSLSIISNSFSIDGYQANLTLILFLLGAMQGQVGWKLQGKTFFLAFMGKQLFQITRWQVKEKGSCYVTQKFSHYPWPPSSRHTESH